MARPPIPRAYWRWVLQALPRLPPSHLTNSLSNRPRRWAPGESAPGRRIRTNTPRRHRRHPDEKRRVSLVISRIRQQRGAMTAPPRVRGGQIQSQMGQEPLGERLWMFPMHEVPAWDLLHDVLVLEHPRGASIVRWLDDWIIEPGKDDRWHHDARLQ